MRSAYFGWFLACLCLSTAQLTKSSESPDEQAIRHEDAAWLKAVHANDIDRIVSFYADDACEFPNRGTHRLWKEGYSRELGAHARYSGFAADMAEHESGGFSISRSRIRSKQL